MTECQFCKSKLVTEGLSSGQQICCANCKSLSRFGKVEKVGTDRLAWRSFWLGVSSIVLLTITGVPAIYYGVRSLLRMRFVKPDRGDQAAAIAGTTLGGCFGVLVGFIVTCVVTVGLIRFWTSTESIVPAEVAQQCDQFFKFSSPHVTPVRAVSAMNSQYLFDFADTTDAEKSDRKIIVRLAFIRASLQPVEAVIASQLRQMRLGETRFGAKHEAEYLDWRLGDQSINVKKSVYSRTLDSGSATETTEETHRHYWGYVSGSDGLYGMAVLFEPGSYQLTDADVQTIFAETLVHSRE